MLQKDKFITKLSKSPSPKPGETAPRTATGLETPVQFVKGVGPRLGSVFRSREIETVRDLLFFFPRTYEDRSKVQAVSKLADGVKASLTVRVLSARYIPIRKLGRSIFEVRCTDESGVLSLKWFRTYPGMEKRFVPGAQISVTGKVKFFNGAPEIVHPEMTGAPNGGAATPVAAIGAHSGGNSLLADTGEAEDSIHSGRIVPIYVEIEGVPSRSLRKVVWEALQKFEKNLEEDLPPYLLEQRKLPEISASVRNLHFPQEKYELEALSTFRTPAHQRLIYGEFFKFEYLILRQRLNIQKTRSPVLNFESLQTHVRDQISKLPFTLTGAQAATVNEILADFAEPFPMNRLVQGDVGSGKTAVAMLSAAGVLAEGGQAAMMVPTEILAEQHFKSANRLFGDRLKVALLTGKTPTSERTPLLKRLAAGEPLLLIGTHALLEEPVQFSRLALAIVDEQHRFGVEQRKTLRHKGVIRNPDSGEFTVPHSLILTATPIPRTLALTAFGDLAVSMIRELPPGRTPVKTHVVSTDEKKLRAFERIRQELQQGRQAYFIYPLVNESEAEGFTQLKSAVAEAEYLANEIFPEFKVGLLHGQMSGEEKANVMERFQRNELQILVSTTVVEVGVDVPNATIMAIEHAERFGLSQLHQLRGRVGRGQFQSICFLFSKARPTGATAAGIESGGVTALRLEVLEETNDGFEIAEADLKLRGPGEFLGTRQAGTLPFKIADLVRDREWLIQARDDAMEILRLDPELVKTEHIRLRRYFETEGGVQFERLRTY